MGITLSNRSLSIASSSNTHTCAFSCCYAAAPDLLCRVCSTDRSACSVTISVAFYLKILWGDANKKHRKRALGRAGGRPSRPHAAAAALLQHPSVLRQGASFKGRAQGQA